MRLAYLNSKFIIVFWALFLFQIINIDLILKSIKMKKLQSALLFAFLLFLLSSCKDLCKNITCENGGSCNEGICNCPSGYSGENCEIVDPCLNVTCQNGGSCVNGACNCLPGYSGCIVKITTPAIRLFVARMELA